MRIIADTHILLWAITGSPRLPKSAHELIEDSSSVVVASAVSIWEVAIKYALRRGHIDDVPLSGAEMLAELERAGFDLLAISGRHAARIDTLPPHHSDPFDRLLVAQAMVEGMRLLTHDKALAAYGDAVMPV